MRPRYDDGKDVTTGFVCYASRSDAEAALRKMDGAFINGSEIRVGWAKQPSKVRMDSRETRQHQTNVPPPRLANIPHGAPSIAVTLPHPSAQCVIDDVAVLVCQHGPELEQTLMNQEPSNPKLQFLFLSGSPENIYYRWKTFSLFHGDTLDSWREDAFQMFEHGPYWIPPQCASPLVVPKPHATPSGTTNTSSPLGKPLGDRDRDEFEDLLRALTISSRRIRAAMGFSLDHSESAPEIVQVLTESLTIHETPTQTKIARLFLVSDILHNTSIATLPNLHLFRSGFEATLPLIFKSFNEKLKSITGRISRATFQVREMHARIAECD
jgi:U2-associated protein SR140